MRLVWSSVCIVSAAIMAATVGAAHAGSPATGSFTVTLTITDACYFVAAPTNIVFSSVTFGSIGQTATGSFKVQCSLGASPKITLSGSNDTSTFNLNGQSSSYKLPYSLSATPTGGSAVPVGPNSSVLLGNNLSNATVFTLTAAISTTDLQAAKADTYFDTVNLTVDY